MQAAATKASNQITASLTNTAQLMSDQLQRSNQTIETLGKLWYDRDRGLLLKKNKTFFVNQQMNQEMESGVTPVIDD